MTGTVVELGPGTGMTMKYYAAGTKVIGIEPNQIMHERLRQAADRYDVDLEIRTLRGERLDVDDEVADGVVGSRVLCGVDDPAAVVAEVHRVLRPGATYFFLEHVSAPSGSGTARAQRIALRPHRWLFNGCTVTRDTAVTITDGGFSEVEITEADEGAAAGYTRHHIVGTARK
jgi:SAM-dependent methyltransferase